MWLLQPPESPQRETGRRGGGRSEDCCAIRRSFLTHRQVCRERRSRRDRGGATGTVAASRVFTHRTVAAARNRASGFGGDWRVRQQLPVGVGPDDRMPPGSREPKVSPGLASQKETEEERKQQEERLTLSENRIRETKDLRSTMQ